MSDFDAKVVSTSYSSARALGISEVVGNVSSLSSSKARANSTKRIFENNPKRETRSEPIFIYNRDEKLVLVLSDLTYPYISDPGIVESLNGGVFLDIKIQSNDPRLELIENEGRAVTKNADGSYVEFIIREIEDVMNSKGFVKSMYAEGGEFELIDEFLDSYIQANVSFETALDAIIAGTRYEKGEIDKFYDTKSVDLQNMTVRKGVRDLISMWGGEVRYRVELSGSRVIRRYIDVFKMRGRDIGKRFEDGKDILSASRVLDGRDIKTRMYGKGASDENGKRLTFAGVEWKKSEGDPVDKPKDQTWVGDPDVLEEWGYEGGRRHKSGYYLGQEEDKAQLLLNTWEEYKKNVQLRDTYELEVIQLGEILGIPHEIVRLGDRIRAIVRRMNPKLHSYASIVEYRHNLNNSKLSKVVIGHYRAKLKTVDRLDDLERDYGDKRGELDKKPSIDDIKSEVEKQIEIAEEELKQAMDRIERTKIDLKDAEDAIADARRNPHEYEAKSIVLWDEIVSHNARFTGSVQGRGLTFLEGDFEKVNIIEANIRDARITGELIGAVGTFAGALKVNGTVQMDTENWWDSNYNTYNIDSIMNGLGMKGHIWNGIYDKTYGIDPDRVYGSTSGGSNFGGYELTALGDSNYTELSSLYGRAMTFNIKNQGINSSKNKIMSLNENYTYIHNMLYAQQQIISQDRIKFGDNTQNFIESNGDNLDIKVGSHTLRIYSNGDVRILVNGTPRHLFRSDGVYGNTSGSVVKL